VAASGWEWRPINAISKPLKNGQTKNPIATNNRVFLFIPFFHKGINKLSGQYKPSNTVRVEGKMTPEGADKTVINLSHAAIIATLVFAGGFAFGEVIESLATAGLFS